MPVFRLICSASPDSYTLPFLGISANEGRQPTFVYESPWRRIFSARQYCPRIAKKLLVCRHLGGYFARAVRPGKAMPCLSNIQISQSLGCIDDLFLCAAIACLKSHA